MTSTHASPSAVYAFRFTRREGEYAVGHAPTLDSIAAGLATASDGRHLGTVRKIGRNDWVATTADGFPFADQYATRADAAQALLVTADRVAALDALPTDDEPVQLLDGHRCRVALAGGAGPCMGRPGHEGRGQIADGQPWSHAYVEPAEDDEEPADGSAPGQDAAGVTDPHVPAQLAHLMGEDLLAACGSHGDALGLYVVPSSTPDRVTCPACRPLLQTAEQVADAILDRRPLLDLFPGRTLGAGQAEVVDAGVTLATERLAARYGVTPAEVVQLGRDVVEETLAPVDEPGPEVDDPREQPEPLEWSSIAAPTVGAVHLIEAGAVTVLAGPDCHTAEPVPAGRLSWTTDGVTCRDCLDRAATRYEAHARACRERGGWQAAEQDEAAAHILRTRLRR